MTIAERPPVAAPITAETWPSRLAAGATVLVAALVLFQLGDKSLWYDEAFSIGIVDRPMGDVLWRLANWELNMSPLYLALSGWWRIGQAEWFLRLLPAASAIAAVPALYVLGKRLFDARVGAIAAGLLALHPLAVQWGQQLRAYSLVLLLVIVATTTLLRALEEPDSTRRALAYAAVAALATYAHFFAGLVVGAHALWLVLQRPLPHRLVARAGTALAVLTAPLAWYLVTREGDPLYWVTEETRSAVVETARALTGDSYWGAAAYGVAAAAGLWGVGTGLRARGAGDRSGMPLLAVLWLLVPVLVATASTATVKPLLEGRFLIVVVPALALLAAAGVLHLGNRVGGGLLVALLVVSAMGVWDWHRSASHEDWRGAARLVAEAPEGPVVLEPWGGVFALRYYEDRLDLPARDVLRPEAGDPPAGPVIVEVRRELGGREAYLTPSYLAWRDRHYVLADERRVENLAVRTYRIR